jgi:hypothetical protein
VKRLALLALLAGCAHRPPNVPAVAECVKTVRAACGVDHTDSFGERVGARNCLDEVLPICTNL